jgi:hypothetical protein
MAWRISTFLAIAFAIAVVMWRPTPSAGKPAPSVQPTSSSEDAILKARIRVLEGRLASLERSQLRQPAEKDKPSAATAPPDSKRLRLSDEETDFLLTEHYEKIFNRGQKGSEAARQYRDSILDYFSSLGLGSSALKSVDCTSTACRLEVDGARALGHRLWNGGPFRYGSFYHIEEDENGDHTTAIVGTPQEPFASETLESLVAEHDQ